MKKFVSLLLCVVLCVAMIPLTATADTPTVVRVLGNTLENGSYVVYEGALYSAVEPPLGTGYITYENGTMTVHQGVTLSSTGLAIIECTSGTLTITGDSQSSLTLSSRGDSPLKCSDGDIQLAGSLNVSTSTSGSYSVALAGSGSFKTASGYAGNLNLSSSSAPVIGSSELSLTGSVNLQTTGTVLINHTVDSYGILLNNTPVTLSGSAVAVNGYINCTSLNVTSTGNITMSVGQSTGVPLLDGSQTITMTAGGDITLTQPGMAPLCAFLGANPSMTIQNAQNVTLSSALYVAWSTRSYTGAINVIDCQNVTMKSPSGYQLLDSVALKIEKTNTQGGKVELEGGGTYTGTPPNDEYYVANRDIAIKNYRTVSVKNHNVNNAIVEAPAALTITDCDDVTLIGNGKSIREFLVRFNTDGGTEITPQKLTTAGLVTKPTDPTKSGYTFAGWYKDDATTNEWDFENDQATGATVLYAKWEKKASSSGASVPTYTPTVRQPTTGGSAEVSTAYPAAGNTVTVTPKADDGYVIDTIQVTDPAGNVIEISHNPDGTFSFIQPAVEVTVAVTYKQKPSFLDVPDDAWYLEALNFTVENGLMSGTSATTFEPDSPMTRAMFAAVLWNLSGKPNGFTASFADVNVSGWYYSAIAWASENGVISGHGDGTFAPNAEITREQMVVMLWNFAGKPATTDKLGSFTDRGEVSSWAETAMAWAVENEVISGKENNMLDPLGTATRAEVTVLLANYLNK